MPQTRRTVSGDFEITVKVTDSAPADPNAEHDERETYTRAGLLVQSGGHGLELCLVQSHSGVELKREIWSEVWIGGCGENHLWENAEDGKSTWLRVTRKGKDVTVSYSFDGQNWSKPENPRRVGALAFPEEVTVGVFLAHSTHQTLDATFDTFTVEKPKEKTE
jgi:regulation of enolase protein 1 (concanavalin A-like superfamily)